MRRMIPISGAEFYPTPAWATRALLANETFEGMIWEPACGDGAMSDVLAQAGYDVFSSDLHNHGYGNSDIDFLTVDTGKVDNIITNPPFNIAEGFVQNGLRLSTGKLCLLLRLAFLEGVHRYKSIFSVRSPSRVWAFSERITMYPQGEAAVGHGTMAFAWFVWDHADTTGATQLSWLRPGFKERLGPRAVVNRSIAPPRHVQLGFF